MNICLILVLKLLVVQVVVSENNTANELISNNEPAKQLSRRKRFVIFPDGCSLQLVFCNQMMGLIPIGDIFIFGYTAALAWVLPSDPKYIYMFKDYERPLRRSDDITKTINYLDEYGKIIARVPYKKRFIVNPAFAKRSIEDNILEKTMKIDRKEMHEKEMKRVPIKYANMDKETADYHRSNRLELYTKIETLLSTVGRDGKQCVLYKLCEAGKSRKGQGTFLHEILNAVFTLPKGEAFEEEYKAYDTAHNDPEDCSKRYPGCVIVQLYSLTLNERDVDANDSPRRKRLIISIVTISVITENIDGKFNGTLNGNPTEHEGSQILSRRKRYLIFPDGSSLQLVFCNQVTAAIPIGDIFLFGYTAALAWQLPSDPKYINMLQEIEKPLRRSNQLKNTVNFFDEDARINAKVPFKKRIQVNTAFAKRSIDGKIYFKEMLKLKRDREKMQESQIQINFMKAGYHDEDTRAYHRNNRLDFYKKLEIMIDALGGNGRQCVLYKLCETAQRRRGQGTFLQEFLAVVFTLPKSHDLEEDLDPEYDAAQNVSNDCFIRYPGCMESSDNF